MCEPCISLTAMLEGTCISLGIVHQLIVYERRVKLKGRHMSNAKR